ISYQTAFDHINAVSAYLLAVGVQKGDRAALIMDNSAHDLYFDQGLQQIRAVNGSVYPTLAADEIEYIINHSGSQTILVGSPLLLKKTLKVANSCECLARIIVDFDNYSSITEGKKLTAGIISFNNLVSQGSHLYPQYEREIVAACEGIIPSDLSTL